MFRLPDELRLEIESHSRSRGRIEGLNPALLPLPTNGAYGKETTGGMEHSVEGYDLTRENPKLVVEKARSCFDVLNAQVTERREMRTPSGTLLRWEEEECDRLLCKNKDSRRVRMFRSLRLLPRNKHTMAEVGVQSAGGEDFAKKLSQLSLLEEDSKKDIETVQDLIEQVETMKQRQEELTLHMDTSIQEATQHTQLAEEEIDTQRKQCAEIHRDMKSIQKYSDELEGKLAKCKIEQLAAEKDVKEGNAALEKKELEAAFLQEEKEDTETLAADRWERLEALNEKYMVMESQRDDYQALYIHAKAEYTSQLSRYLAKLQSALQDKRYLIKKGLKQIAKETTPAETLKTAEMFLQREEENCRLTEQIEYLSAQSVAQDLRIQQLSEELDEYTGLAKSVFCIPENKHIKGPREALLPCDRLMRRYSSATCRALGELVDICRELPRQQGNSGDMAQEDYDDNEVHDDDDHNDHDETESESEADPEVQSDSEAQLSGGDNEGAMARRSGGGEVTRSPLKRLIGILKKPSHIPTLVEKYSTEEETEEEEQTDTDQTESTSSSPRKELRLSWEDQQPETA